MPAFLTWLVFFANPWWLIAFILIAIWGDHDNNGALAGFSFIGAIAIALSLFEVSLLQIGIVAGLWVPIGLAWSMYRFRRQAGRAVKDFECGKIGKYDAQRQANAAQNKGRIIYWGLFWPVSLIESFAGDVIDSLEQAFSGVYARISGNALSKIDAIDSEKS